MAIIREPKVYLIGRSSIVREGLDSFLADEGMVSDTDTSIDTEELAETAGRVCYMSFGKGRKTNREYLSRILESKHGSVLEHNCFTFIVTGISRTCTHEWVRHRAGFSYSQLSQRYVDESDCDFVIPPLFIEYPELGDDLTHLTEELREKYKELVKKASKFIKKKYPHIESRTTIRKMARESARSVLPNATETKMVVSANARAWRHFIEMRASDHAEAEIRRVAVIILKILQNEAPNIFGDYEIYRLADGSEAARTVFSKV